MSRSNQFSTKRTKYRNWDIEDLQYKELHWTKQLEIRPLKDRVRKEYEQGDYSTRLEMDWDDNITIDKEIT